MPVLKTSRLDLRLTEQQRDVINQAAESAGSTVTGWGVAALVAAAREQLQSSRVTTLSNTAWDEFVASLSTGLPSQAEELLERQPVWDRQ